VAEPGGGLGSGHLPGQQAFADGSGCCLVCRGEPWLSQAVLGGVVTYLASKRLPVAGVIAWFSAGDRGLVRQCSGEWSPTWPASVCLWLGLSLGLPQGTVAKSSGAQGSGHLPGRCAFACGWGYCWVYRGEPWLSRAVAWGVVAYPAGVRLPVAGVVAGFTAGNRG